MNQPAITDRHTSRNNRVVAHPPGKKKKKKKEGTNKEIHLDQERKRSIKKKKKRKGEGEGIQGLTEAYKEVIVTDSYY